MLKSALLSPALFTPFWTHRKIPRFRNRPQNSQRLGAIDSNTLAIVCLWMQNAMITVHVIQLKEPVEKCTGGDLRRPVLLIG